MKDKKMLYGFTAVIVVLVLVVVALFLRKPEPAQVEAPAAQGSLTLDTSQSESDGSLVDKKEAVTPTFIATGYYDLALHQNEKMYLVNDAENEKEDYTVVIQYTISDTETGEEIFETGLIEPGNSVPFEASAYLSVGEHRVSILEQPYLMEDGEWVPKFSAAQEITITVTD